MKIWLDADGAPRLIKEILVRASERREVDMVFVANGWLEKPKAARIEVVLVSQGPDVADDHIVEHCEAGDLVVTADIPLAARVVEKGAEVITPHGKPLDEANVREALSFRDFAHELREIGVQTGGPSGFGEKEKRDFANALDRWITRNS